MHTLHLRSVTVVHRVCARPSVEATCWPPPPFPSLTHRPIPHALTPPSSAICGPGADCPPTIPGHRQQHCLSTQQRQRPGAGACKATLPVVLHCTRRSGGSNEHGGPCPAGWGCISCPCRASRACALDPAPGTSRGWARVCGGWLGVPHLHPAQPRHKSRRQHPHVCRMQVPVPGGVKELCYPPCRHQRPRCTSTGARSWVGLSYVHPAQRA